MLEGEHEEEDEVDEVKKEGLIENRVKEIDVAEHVEALVNGEGDLSEEFKRNPQQCLKVLWLNLRFVQRS